MQLNEKYIQRCLELAEQGLGHVAPNPMVGAILVHEEKIIGEGFHQEFGKAHAEVNAIENAIKNGASEKLAHSTLYVNLEPCTHFGKTPPCTDFIIQKKIPTVVVACTDPFPEVNGKGIAKLKAAGIKVSVGVLESEARELNRRFFIFCEMKRPYIILKFARSRDGFLSADKPTEENRWITNIYSKKLVHKWRTEESAVLVGTNTALKDNPRLNVREWKGRNPVRIVIDRKLSLPLHLHLFDCSQKTIVINESKSMESDNLEYIKLDFSNSILSQLMSTLFEKGIQSLIVEGGKILLDSFIRENMWDEVRMFTGNKWLKSGLLAPFPPGKLISEIRVDDDGLSIFKPV